MHVSQPARLAHRGLTLRRCIGFACIGRWGRWLLLAIILTGGASLSIARTAEPTASAAEQWPQFRGPDSAGVSLAAGLPERWSTEENVRWKRDLPGLGWSSPIIWGRQVFVTTVVGPDPIELPKKGLYFAGEQVQPPEAVHQWKVICLDLDTGEIRWDRTVHEAPPPSTVHKKNSYASETPVTDGEHVYALFGNVGLWCLDLEGQVVWSKPFAPRQTRLGWGTGASPVLAGDKLLVIFDNEEESTLAALDKRTGDERWRVVREEKSNWATPFVWRNPLRTEIITPGTSKVRAYDLEGQPLYEFAGMSSISIPTPLAAHGLLYVSSGYVLDSTRPIFALRPGASGDITLADDATTNEWIAWHQPTAGPYNPSPLVVGDLMYVLLDRGFLACYDARTGAEVYERQRIPDGRAFTASPWSHGDRVFATNEDGQTFVFATGPKFELLGTNPLAEDDMALATPAMVRGRLLIRTAPRIYCFEQLGAAETRP
jgi:outer membrane protein assembly factor BamB